ncbi:hypothetical protein ACFVUS_30000 [Nocardia sp. NPDC058058]
MSMAIIVTIGVLTPITGAIAAYATVAATYWWEKRSSHTPG